MTSMSVEDHTILQAHCSIRLDGETCRKKTETLLVQKLDHYPTFATVSFARRCGNNTIKYLYTIDSLTLRWDVTIANAVDNPQEIGIALVIPLSKSMRKIFHSGYYAPLDLEETTDITLTYRKHLYIPMITRYSSVKNYGISIIAPLEIPKPGLTFSMNPRNLIVSYHHLRVGPNKDATAALCIVPHEGCWRPGFDYILKTYPKYLNPAVENTRTGEGLYYLSLPSVNEKKIRELQNRDVKWIEFHEYFPFYGLYVPKSPEWGIVIDSDEVTISDWEKGAGRERNSREKVVELVNLWQKYGIQVYLYFQSSEAWHEYAEKYFSSDIARNAAGKPLPSWKFTNLMNADPQSKWGKYILHQAENILKEYPNIDGIFFDRMDYEDYDFAHSDNQTIVDKRPAYMLGFAQERINEKLFDLFHRNKKGIWGNGPTSIEVCKDLDGIMAEKSLGNLLKIQYLGLTRPIIYLPYDKLPYETEEKLKYALICGAFPCLTYGGKKCQEIETKYKPLFELIKNRTWVLTSNPLETPRDIQGNVFQAPNGDYVVAIITPEKSQLLPNPFEHNMPITITVRNPEDINYAYLLSGDWRGVNAIDFEKRGNSLRIEIPWHLSSSLIYLKQNRKKGVTRLTPPLIMKGQPEDIVFHLEHTGFLGIAVVTLTTPWSKQTKIATNKTIAFHPTVPEDVEGEVEMVVTCNGRKEKISCWVIDPISIAPVEAIFIHDQEGENIQFDVVNNTNTDTQLSLQGMFVEGIGTIEVPSRIVLKALERKRITIFIKPHKAGLIQLTASSEKEGITYEFPVSTSLRFDEDDLFHDDFKKAMIAWKIARGQWHTSNGVAQGSGQAHFAYVENEQWRNYLYEVTARCRGSMKQGVDWLKLYIFFRFQDEQNFYRFGIHGDAGLVDLYKCMNGRWIRLHTSVFTPTKDKWHTLRIVAENAKIIGYIDGTKVIEAEDSTFLRGGIGIGVLEDAMRCDYKNVVVKEL